MASHTEQCFGLLAQRVESEGVKCASLTVISMFLSAGGGAPTFPLNIFRPTSIFQNSSQAVEDTNFSQHDLNR